MWAGSGHAMYCPDVPNMLVRVGISRKPFSMLSLMLEHGVSMTKAEHRN